MLLRILNPGIPQRRRKAGRRQGLSLLEVVFSIGVVIVGLLGAVALLPLAARNAAQGVTADRMAYYGKACVQDFSLRGFGRPDLWASYFPSAGSGMGAGGPGIYPLMRPGQTNPTYGQWFANSGWQFSPSVGQAFCIDPRFVAINAGNTAGIYNAQAFPYYDQANANDPRMARITLKASAQVANVAMGSLQAEQVFTSHDSLSIDLPSDRSLPPVQRFHATSGVPIKRDFLGKMSWMATLVPKLDETGDFRDIYTLSVVIFQNRDSSMAMDSGKFELTNNERMADVVFTGGPEVRLVTIDPSRPPVDLELESRDWVMLGAVTAPVPPVALGGRPMFRWFRVLAADDEVIRWNAGGDGDWGVSGVDDDGDLIVDNSREAGWPGSDDVPNAQTGPFIYTRFATLDGPDWDRPEWAPGGRYDSSTNTRSFRHTRATLVTGVVTVYEKSIRLESTSLWNR